MAIYASGGAACLLLALGLGLWWWCKRQQIIVHRNPDDAPPTVAVELPAAAQLPAAEGAAGPAEGPAGPAEGAVAHVVSEVVDSTLGRYHV